MQGWNEMETGTAENGMADHTKLTLVKAIICPMAMYSSEP